MDTIHTLVGNQMYLYGWLRATDFDVWQLLSKAVQDKTEDLIGTPKCKK